MSGQPQGIRPTPALDTEREEIFRLDPKAEMAEIVLA
jgi:hypothetical protein